MNDTHQIIADEIESAMDEVLIDPSLEPSFSSRFRQLVRNAINNNVADSDIRSVIDAAPTGHPEGE